MIFEEVMKMGIKNHAEKTRKWWIVLQITQIFKRFTQSHGDTKEEKKYFGRD